MAWRCKDYSTTPYNGAGKADYCANCGKKAEADYLVCPFCRFDLSKHRDERKATSCADCGAARTKGAGFCHKCGKKH